MQGLSGTNGISTAVRLILTVVTSLSCIILSNFWALMFLFAASVLYVFIEARLTTIIKAYIVFALMAAFATACLMLLFYIVPVMSNTTTRISVIIPFVRLAVMMNMLLATSAKASFTGLANTLNAGFIPGSIRIPMIVMIRFIPVFLGDLQQLREAVKIRFAGKAGFFYWLRHPSLWMRIFFVPLVVRLIRSGDELAVSAELKGLNVNTSLGKANMKPAKADIFAISLLVIFVTSAALIQRYFNA